MDPHTLRILEYDALKALLRERARTIAGQRDIMELAPLTDRALIQRRLKETSELRLILQTEGDFPLYGLTDVSETLALARATGTMLEAQQILDINRLLQSSRMVSGFFKLQAERAPLLCAYAAQLTIHKSLESSISNTIDEANGEIFDHASPELSRIRRALNDKREQLQQKLSQLIDKLGEKNRTDFYVTMREGRFVIPIRQEDKNKVRGIIHDQSASGATVFMEPLATVPLNNELRQLEQAEKTEIIRILTALTDEVRAVRDQLLVNFQVLTYLDVVGARARLALDFNCIEPIILINQRLNLVNARHILLENILKQQERQASIVANSVQFADDICTILITGPNTGGKTVLLKTIGLLVLMTQTGLHIPAKDGSHLPVYTQVFADIGDEQSLQQSLSTFSAHIRHIIHFVEKADDQTLILLDELGSGTDPEEGVALGMALLDYLTQVKATTLATTHYGDLKIFAHQHPHIINGSMEFARATLTPTFRFQQNIPGSSYALQIAELLGMPHFILDHARSKCRPEERNIASLIATLEDENQRLLKLQETVSEERAELEKRVQKYDKKMAEIAEIKAQIRDKAVSDAAELIRSTKQSLQEAIRQVKQEKAAEKTVRQARETIQLVEQKIEAEKPVSPQMVAAEKPELPLTSVQVGQKVKIRDWKTEGTILEVKDNDHINVAIGQMRINVSLDKLAAIAPQENRLISADRYKHYLADGANISTEIDLRGLTAEEALPRIDKYLDDAYLATLERVRIIHGKGTGALRKKVTMYLASHPRVAEHTLAEWNEGGAGVTIVKLKLS